MGRLSLFCLFGRLRRREKRASNAPSVAPPATPEHQQPTPRVSSSITLETLPAELRHLILESIEDIKDLKALVFASPVYHQQYLHSRKWLLRRTLQTTLGNGNVLADAYAAHTSGSLHEEGVESHIHADTFRLFMDQYIAHRSVGPGQVWAEAAATEDDLIEMAAFYLAVTCPLLRICSSVLLMRLNRSPDDSRLSRAERTRFLRALYRYQTYCNIFGMRPGGDYKPFNLPHEERLVSFFGLFPPWEIEEINCIYALVRDKCEKIFDTTTMADLAKDHPGSDPAANRYLRSFNLSSPCKCHYLGIASRGLHAFLEIVQTPDDETLVRAMQKYMVWHERFLEETMMLPTQWRRRSRHPSAEDQAQARRDRLPFVGDEQGLMDGRSPAPPVAWVVMWRGQFKNEYGQAVDERFRKWGYVFWDCKRLKESGRRETLVRDLRNPDMTRMRWD
ncbi:uncharacterized protein B0H64DRAFT_367002 [Chaetomium fimeti]|uniref:F-box domain-containing protein n=1 Tax=Chaetomium fimeti TaxID=1854472 RepID=A0AAE0H7X6_9PEZI|nr:hypothetical protein B0H64DRAFT_367002 [Chaetomium fimeti]